MASKSINPQTIVMDGMHSASLPTRPAKPVPQVSKADNQEISSYGKHIKWGKSDTYANDIYGKSKNSTLIAPKLNDITAMMYGGGVITGIYEGQGKDRHFVPKIFDEFEEFRELGNYDTFFFDFCKQTAWWYWPVPLAHLNATYDKILRWDIKSSMMYRYHEPDKKGDRPTFIDFNPDFGNTEDPNNTVSIPIIDMWYDPAGNLKKQLENKDSRKGVYAMPHVLPGMGNTHYYPTADWHVAIFSGWVEFACMLVEYKKAITKNQTANPFAWYIHKDFWGHKVKDYDKLSFEKKVEAQQSYMTTLNTFFTEKENKGKGMIFAMVDSHNGRENKKLVERVDFKNMYLDSMYIEDMGEAMQQILSALGSDKSIGGEKQTSGMANSGGSDKRVGFNIQSAMYNARRDFILQHVKMTKRFNGWDKSMQFSVETVEVNTADQRSEITAKPAANNSIPPAE